MTKQIPIIGQQKDPRVLALEYFQSAGQSNQMFSTEFIARKAKEVGFTDQQVIFLKELTHLVLLTKGK